MLLDGCRLFHGDCLAVMAELPPCSVDAVVADLPYGTTYAKWDSVIPLPALWAAIDRVLKPRGAAVLTASQPFTSTLVASRPDWFRCEWIWDKVNGANFSNARAEPLKTHESVLVFGSARGTYNPIKTPGRPNHSQGSSTTKHSDLMRQNKRAPDDLSGMKFPKTIVQVAKHSSQSALHPAQKPVELMDYFIRTYTNVNDVVLDPTMGSGTTGVAALEAGRWFVGIERDEAYFETARKRILE